MTSYLQKTLISNISIFFWY